MLALKIVPFASCYVDRPFVQSKKGSLRNSAAGGGLHPPSLLISNQPELRRTAYHKTLADILGFFIIKKLLNRTLFLLHKRPTIFNVLAIASA
jgi:hypothetical protein